MKKIIVLAFIVNSGLLVAQDRSNEDFFSDLTPGLVMGYIQQEKSFLTAGGLYQRLYDKSLKQTMSIGFCTDVSINATRLIVGPRVFADFSINKFGIRINISDYYQRTNHEVRITPEFFVTLAGRVNLNGGYSFPVSGSPSGSGITGLGGYRVSLVFNFLKEK